MCVSGNTNRLTNLLVLQAVSEDLSLQQSTDTVSAMFKKEKKVHQVSVQDLGPLRSELLVPQDRPSSHSLFICNYLKVGSQTNYTPDTFEAKFNMLRKRLYA